jgi:adenosylhomocysteine nucleosidase
MKPFVLLLLLLLSLGPLRAESADVLLAAATDRELQPLIALLESPHSETRAAWQFWLGTLRGKKVVLTRTEGDPLNAVAATTLAIRRYSPRLVITFGTARPHDPALQTGDTVVSEKFAAFDGLVSRVTPLDGGVAPSAWYRLPHLLATEGEKETPAYSFPADPAAAVAALNLPSAHGRIIGGVLGSAHQVNREADRIAWLRQNWGTSCEDGESAHIAGCAQLLGVPVIGLRVIQADHAPADTTAEQTAGAIALQLLEALK